MTLLKVSGGSLEGGLEEESRSKRPCFGKLRGDRVDRNQLQACERVF